MHLNITKAKEKTGGGTTHHSGEEAQGLQVLQDVWGARGDEQHVEAVQRLVHVAHRLGLHEGVLPPAGHQLGEGRQQAFNPGLGHLHKLPGHQSLAAAGTDGRGKKHLEARVTDIIMIIITASLWGRTRLSEG